MTPPSDETRFDVVSSGYDITQVNEFLERSGGEPSRLHGELLKRATKRIQELESQVSDGPRDAAGVRDLEARMRDLHAEVGDRIGTMSTAYQRLVSELRTMSMSIQELSALSTAMSETLSQVNAAGAALTATEPSASPFALDVPEPKVTAPPPVVAGEQPPPVAEPLVDEGSKPGPAGDDPDGPALAAVADRLLAALADAEASLEAAVDGDAWMDAVPAVEPTTPENAAPENASRQDAAPVEASTRDAGTDDATDTGEDGGRRPGSFYTRRSAKLPRLGDASADALAAARSVRGH